jgi:hypothetical protein
MFARSSSLILLRMLAFTRRKFLLSLRHRARLSALAKGIEN